MGKRCKAIAKSTLEQCQHDAKGRSLYCGHHKSNKSRYTLMHGGREGCRAEEVNTDCDDGNIRKKAIYFHPDKNPYCTEVANEKFKEYNSNCKEVSERLARGRAARSSSHSPQTPDDLDFTVNKDEREYMDEFFNERKDEIPSGAADALPKKIDNIKHIVPSKSMVFMHHLSPKDFKDIRLGQEVWLISYRFIIKGWNQSEGVIYVEVNLKTSEPFKYVTRLYKIAAVDLLRQFKDGRVVNTKELQQADRRRHQARRRSQQATRAEAQRRAVQAQRRAVQAQRQAAAKAVRLRESDMKHAKVLAERRVLLSKQCKTLPITLLGDLNAIHPLRTVGFPSLRPENGVGEPLSDLNLIKEGIDFFWRNGPNSYRLKIICWENQTDGRTILFYRGENGQVYKGGHDTLIAEIVKGNITVAPPRQTTEAPPASAAQAHRRAVQAQRQAATKAVRLRESDMKHAKVLAERRVLLSKQCKTLPITLLGDLNAIDPLRTVGFTRLRPENGVGEPLSDSNPIKEGIDFFWRNEANSYRLKIICWENQTNGRTILFYRGENEQVYKGGHDTLIAEIVKGNITVAPPRQTTEAPPASAAQAVLVFDFDQTFIENHTGGLPMSNTAPSLDVAAAKVQLEKLATKFKAIYINTRGDRVEVLQYLETVGLRPYIKDVYGACPLRPGYSATSHGNRYCIKDDKLLERRDLRAQIPIRLSPTKWSEQKIRYLDLIRVREGLREDQKDLVHFYDDTVSNVEKAREASFRNSHHEFFTRDKINSVALFRAILGSQSGGNGRKLTNYNLFMKKHLSGGKMNMKQAVKLWHKSRL